MSIRDPDYDPRQRHPRSGAHPAGARPGQPAWLLPAIAVCGIVLLVVVGLGSGVLGRGAEPSAAGPSALLGLASPAASADGSPPAGTDAASAPGSTDASSSPDPADAVPSPQDGQPAPPATTAAPVVVAADADVAIVPVTSFRSPRASVTAADVTGIARGSSPYKGLVLVKSDADGILAALKLDRAALGKALVTVTSAEALAEHVAANRSKLGFLRADEVGPSVRALAWGSKSLFGVDRVASLAKWPLLAHLAGPAPGAATYDPSGAWTLVAGGDILLDRGVSLAIKASPRGAAFPYDGGTVKITGRCKDCSPMGWDLPYTKRTGNAGDFRDLVSGADLALANFENPAPNSWRFHGKGMVFSADPKLIKGIADAGFDWVSMANNHIGDAGRNGIVQTMQNLDKYGVRHGGAGRNTAEAHKATLMKAGGVTVGILGYDTIAAYYQSGASTPGSARMTAKALKADIKAARAAGADLVVVFPHWGTEYRAIPNATQRTLGKAAIDAGADLVIGNHPHWAEGMEVYKGRPIWYALGNLVFDQTWSEPTMEGITLELTFRGTHLVQARMRPHLIMDKAQPNFMDPAGSGKVVMDQVWRGSKGLLPW